MIDFSYLFEKSAQKEKEKKEKSTLCYLSFALSFLVSILFASILVLMIHLNLLIDSEHRGNLGT